MTTAAAILYRRLITALTWRCTFLFSVSMRKCFACMVFRTMREVRGEEAASWLSSCLLFTVWILQILESFYYSFDLLMWKQLVINLTISVSVKEIMSNKFYFEPGYQPLHSNLVNIAIFRFEYGNIQIWIWQFSDLNMAIFRF